MSQTECKLENNHFRLSLKLQFSYSKIRIMFKFVLNINRMANNKRVEFKLGQ